MKTIKGYIRRPRRIIGWLAELSGGGGGGGSRTVEGVPPLGFRAAAAGEMTNYRLYGNSTGQVIIGKNKFNDSLAMGFLSYPDSVVDDRVTRQHQVGSTQLDAGTYTVSWKTNVGYCNVMVYVYDSNGTAVSRQPDGWSYWSYSETFTLNEPGSVRLVFRRQNDADMTLSDIHSIQIEAGSSATAYEPYSETIPAVGDKTVNLCDGVLQQGYWNFGNGIKYSSDEWVCTTNKFLCKEGYTYSLSSKYQSYRYGIAWYRTTGTFVSGSQTETAAAGDIEFTAAAPAEATYFAVNIGSGVSGQAVTPEDIDDLMVVEGSNLPAEFVPYGYKIPVTVTNGTVTQTEDIYLDTPLSVSGNSADYIDYENQKRINADGTQEDVTLPELGFAAGSNTLSVGTVVQPTKVSVTGAFREEES